MAYASINPKRSSNMSFQAELAVEADDAVCMSTCSYMLTRELAEPGLNMI